MSRLAFDTATAACSVAVESDGGAIFQRRPGPGRMFERPAHTTELLPVICELIDEAETGFEALTSVVVGTGPGAFTGLRIGIASARAIATAMGIPVVPVSSLATLAAGSCIDRDSGIAGDLRRPVVAPSAPAQISISNPILDPAPVLPVIDGLQHGVERDRGDVVIAVIDARRDEFFNGAYMLGRPGENVSIDSVSRPEHLLEFARELVVEHAAVTAVGNGAIKLAVELGEVGVRVPGEGDPVHVVSAATMLRLADGVDPVSPGCVQPNYIRAPDASEVAREPWLAGPSS